MSKLKAGHVNDFENSMAAEIEAAMQSEWTAVKGQSLSSAGLEDRKIMWVAIARGVLKFLTEHRTSVVTTNASADSHHHSVEWDYE